MRWTNLGCGGFTPPLQEFICEVCSGLGGGSDRTYFEDLTDYLSNALMEGYDSDGDQSRHVEFMVEVETTARIQHTALLSTEHARFMAWFVEKGKQELYAEFEKVVCMDQTKGDYLGVSVRDLPKN